MNWLITGGCGFIGANLIAALLDGDENFSIRVIDNLSVGGRDDLPNDSDILDVAPGDVGDFWHCGRVEFVVGDIKDEQLAVRAAQGADIIVHLAANTGVLPSVEKPRSDCLTNVLGTLNYLEAARLNNVKRFIFASSGAPAGEIVPPITEEAVPHPVSPYGASKLAGEGYCSAYFLSYGVEAIALRFSNVYGPGSLKKNSVVAKFLRSALQTGRMEIYGDGKQTRDFIYIDDLIRAILVSSHKEGIGGQIFQIATSNEVSIDLLAQKIAKKLFVYGESSIEITHLATQKGEVRRNFSDIGKAKAVLGWEPAYSLDVGLEKTAQHFRDAFNKE